MITTVHKEVTWWEGSEFFTLSSCVASGSSWVLVKCVLPFPLRSILTWLRAAAWAAIRLGKWHNKDEWVDGQQLVLLGVVAV